MLLDLLAEFLPAKLERCLDIAGGGDVAQISSILRERYAGELHAVDLGEDVTRGAAHGIAAVRCDIDREPLPYPAEHFDFVLFNSVIEHLYHPRLALSEIARVLRPRGVLFLEAPNAVAHGRRLDMLFGGNPFSVFHRYNLAPDQPIMTECAVFYTPQDLAPALAPDFSVLSTRYAMHSPPLNPLKRALRELAFRLAPRGADCFFLVARRSAPPTH